MSRLPKCILLNVHKPSNITWEEVEADAAVSLSLDDLAGAEEASNTIVELMPRLVRVFRAYDNGDDPQDRRAQDRVRNMLIIHPLQICRARVREQCVFAINRLTLEKE